jgi:hypothetical protein
MVRVKTRRWKLERQREHDKACKVLFFNWNIYQSGTISSAIGTTQTRGSMRSRARIKTEGVAGKRENVGDG